MISTTGILAAFISVLVSRAVAIKCLSCTEVARPRDCGYVQECGPHEKCSIEAYVMTSGLVTYNVGCMDRTKCAAVGRKRTVLNVTVLEEIQQKDGFATILDKQWDQNQGDMLVCAECCDTELCNVKGCGQLGLPPDSGPVCCGCQSQQYPDQCNKIILCARDYACHLSTSRLGGDLVYNSGCKHTQECSQLGSLNIGAFDLVGRRSGFDMTSKVERAVLCNKCCTINLCNADTCSSVTHLSITSPITTRAPTNGTREVLNGLNVTNPNLSYYQNTPICDLHVWQIAWCIEWLVSVEFLSVTCCGGQYYRIHVCNNPSPAIGCDMFNGPNRQTQSCNEHPCVGGCLYKGQTYEVGHNWQDGCDYTCTCVNGTIGFYQCNSLCLTWNLPSACYMEPPTPGKCCHQPKCPDYIRIEYPVGYQEL